MTIAMNYQDKITMIRRLDERRAALRDFSQYADTVGQIERLISMVQVTIDDDERANNIRGRN